MSTKAVDRKRPLTVETLESRLNLSALPGGGGGRWGEFAVPAARHVSSYHNVNVMEYVNLQSGNITA